MTLGYDSQDRLISVTSPISGTSAEAGFTPSYTTTIQYNAGSTVVTQGTGTQHAIVTTYTLDSAGRATAVADALGDTDHYAYDADNDVTSHQDGNGNVTSYSYQYIGPNANYGQVTETDYPAIAPLTPGAAPARPVAHYVYDPSAHDLTEAYDNLTETAGYAAGAVTYYTYNGHHDLATEAQLVSTHTSNGVTTYSWRGLLRQYDALGELTAQTDGRGVTVPSTTSVSPAPGVTPNSQQASYTHTWSYDGQGNLTSSATPPITTNVNGTIKTAPAITQYTYDVDGNQVSMQSANNYNQNAPTANATVYGYDHLGRLDSTITPPMPTLAAPGGPTNLSGSARTTIAFDGDGNPAQTMDGNEAATNTSYDPLGRLVSEDQPLSLISDSGMVTATTIMTYTATELTAMRDPQGNVTTYTYDAAGRRTGQTDAAGEVRTYGYDAANNVTSIALGDGTTTETTVGRTYDALNQVATETVSGQNLSPSLTTTYSYDLHGNLARQQDPNGDTTFVGYDLVGEPLTQELDPGAPAQPTGAHQESFAYDAAGNRVSATDFRGGLIQVSVDGDDRQTQQVATYTGTPSITTSAQYDPDGNLVSQSEVTNGQTHTYTTSLNTADWTSGSTNDGLSTSLIGDGGGAPQQQTIQNGGGTIAYNTDNAERAMGLGVTSIGSTTPLTSTFAYNANSLTTQIALPNGAQENVGYDGASRLTSLTAQDTGNPSLLSDSFGYGYDHVGWTTSINSTLTGGASSSLTLGHDALGRLVSQAGTTTGSWAYDGRGNLTSSTSNGVISTYSYSASNPEEVASVATGGQPTLSYGYDAAGDTTSISGGSPAPVSIFTSQTPASSYRRAYELGVKFQSSVAGSITGIRFYKEAGETGTHTGHLWSASGTLLGSVTFANESASGWQTATFASPVAIAAHTTYVASYNDNTVYGATLSGLASSVTNGPLATVADGSNGVGGNPGTFPTGGQSTSNYFADVVFQPAATNEQLGYDALGRLAQVTLGNPVTETVTMSYNALGQRASYTVTPAGAGQPSLSEQFQYRGGELAQVSYSGTGVPTPYTIVESENWTTERGE